MNSKVNFFPASDGNHPETIEVRISPFKSGKRKAQSWKQNEKRSATMHGPLGQMFIDISFSAALQVVMIGFIGGVLSGFIGSGGAFFMTPGMVNLGVHGLGAAARNITPKFGKAMGG